jgi:MOSC domain-containing protein YiiM
MEVPRMTHAARVLSVNVGRARRIAARSRLSGIDKQPVDGAIAVRAPGPKGMAGSGLEGDAVCDLRHHGGDEQAVYAYAREDLDWWEQTIGRPLTPGVFGENLTTEGIDVSGAAIGEQWQVGDSLVLAVTAPRLPCRTFAVWLEQQGWIKRFTSAARPGAYLRVVTPGSVQAGDPVRVIEQPPDALTIEMMFRLMTHTSAS